MHIPCYSYTKAMIRSQSVVLSFSDVVIGFFDDVYDGFEENPNCPCHVNIIVTDRTLEIPLQIRLTPTSINAYGKKMFFVVICQQVHTLHAVNCCSLETNQ